MADTFKTIKVTQPTLGGPLNESLVGAVQVSGGAADAGKVVVLNASGLVDKSEGGAGVVVTNTPTHAGEVLISQPGNTSATWADPQVQGLYAAGSSIASPPVYAPPTTIQPVLVGANRTTDSTLQNLNVDAAGNLNVNVQVGGSTSTTNITQWASTTLGTPTNFGSSPGAVIAGVVNSSIFAGTAALTATGSSLNVNVSNPVNIQASGTALTATGSSLNVNVTNSSGASSVTGGQTAETTATWNPSTPVNTVLAQTVTGYGTVKITLNQGATLSGGVVQFEASDTALGTNWYSINASQDNASSSTPPSTSYALLTNTNQSFTIGSGAWVQVRLRLSTTISVGTVNVGIAAMAFSGGSGGSGGGGGGAQYTEGSTVPTATGTVALGKNYGTNLVSALQLDGSSNLDTNVQLAVFAGLPGSAVPARTVWVAASDGTNLQGLLVESGTNKNLRVSIYNGASEVSLTGSSINANVTNAVAVTQSTSPWVTQDQSDVTAGTTTAPTKILIVGGKTADGTPAYDPIPLIAGGTAVSVKSVDNVSQGSTTSGQVGPLVQGAASTNDPSYTTGQTDPLSLTLQGHLRTQDYAEANANGSTAVPNNALYVGAKGADGFLHPLSTSTNNGFLDVNASFSGTVTTSFIADRIQSGAITSTQTVVVSTQGASSLVFNITGTWTGTIQFQLQLADNSWTTATAYPVDTGGPGVTQTTANGQWQLPVGGWQSFRVIGNTVATGTATANLEAGAGIFSSFVEQLTASTLNVTVGNTVTVTVSGTPTVTANQGTPNSAVNGWPVKVTDGVNFFGVSSTHPFITSDLADGNANGSTTAPTTALLVGAKGADGFLHPLSTSTNNGFLDVNASISGSFTPALTSDNFTSPAGTITANGQSVTLPGNGTQGTGTTMFRISGTWNGTLTFQVSVDGSNFTPAKCLQRFPTGSLASSLTQNSSAVTYWSIATGGIRNFEVTSTAWTSGTATIWIESGAGAQDIQTLSIPFDPASGNFAVIKGASSTPVAADNALVVALSPNSALTTTTVPTTGAEALVVALSPNSALTTTTPPTSSTEALVVALSPNSTQFATSTTANALPGTNPQTIGTSSSAVVNANPSRKELTITNTGTTYIYIGLGQTPTTTSYHIALTKCGVANDGTGGTWTSDMWKGAVNAISSAAGGTVNLVELT